MWNKIKYRIALLFLMLSISQGVAQVPGSGCWLGDLASIMKSSPAPTASFRNFALGNTGFADFQAIRRVAKDRELSNTELLEFSRDLARVSNPNSFIREITGNPRLIDSWRMLDDLGERALRTYIDWLKRVNDWDSAGVQLSKNGNNLKLSDASGNTLGEFKNGELIPETGRYFSTGTSKGDVVNGYQVVDNGGQLGLKRVPDESPYNNSELTELTQHSNAHVLERHGHDVPDEALIKRANEGIAPDGSTTASGNPPAYSSKFNNPQKVRDALNNTRPGTVAFNNGVSKGNRRIVSYTSNSGDFGKGVPINGSTFETTNKVLAIYEDAGGGNYRLLTMYPNF